VINTSREDAPQSLFTIEQLTVVPGRKQIIGGCDLCQHCWLVRGDFLQQWAKHTVRETDHDGIQGKRDCSNFKG
jgi:hypothetical protein